MLYLGIDQHARQITISLRDESGDVLEARQVSTQPGRINAFFEQLTRERLRKGELFVAVLEVCGFNDWLIRMLKDYRCHKVILIQPDDRKNARPTDATPRRSASCCGSTGTGSWTASRFVVCDRSTSLPRLIKRIAG